MEREEMYTLKTMVDYKNQVQQEEASEFALINLIMCDWPFRQSIYIGPVLLTFLDRISTTCIIARQVLKWTERYELSLPFYTQIDDIIQ